MADDRAARARKALRQAQTILRSLPEVASPLIVDAIEQIAVGVEKLAEENRNLAVQQALLEARLLRVERSRLFSIFNRLVSATAGMLEGVRYGLPSRPGEENEDPAAYNQWVAHETVALPSVESARETASRWTFRPTISVLLSARAADLPTDCLESLRRQAYDNFELCVAVMGALESKLSAFPGRIRTVAADGLDDARALNAAADLAAGEYLCILPATGVLPPLAFYYLVEALQQSAADILYSDEDSLDGSRRRVRPNFKPDWSPELLTSTMYIGNLLAVRRDCWRQAGGVSSEAGDAYLYDLVLRLTDAPVRVHHVPRVLYHELRGAPAPGAAHEAIERTIERRERTAATCSLGPVAGTWMVRRAGAVKEITAIICSKSPALLETCLESIQATADDVVRQIVVVAHEERGTDAELHSVIERAAAVAVSYQGPFHFAAMNNLGAAKASSSYLLFLNDDVRATERGWAEFLSEQLSREEIGIAGAVLRYPTGVLQHAGIVVGIGDGVGHPGRYQRSSALWPWLLAAHDVSAVTGACLAIRKELFERLGGFDRLFPNNYNDVDLCFRARADGRRVICVPAPGLIHAECQSRPGVVRFEERYRFYERWAELLRRPDPYYSRALGPEEKISLNLSGEDWFRGLME